MKRGQFATADEEILKHFGDYESLSLENVIDGSEDENEINLFNPSPHYLIEDLPFCLKKEGHLNIMSLNTQSINAKFDSILALLKIAQLQNVKFRVICIQETWLDDTADLSLFQIDGFNCFTQWKHCSSHGGLITYVDSRLNATKICSMNTSSVWEGLFVSIRDSSYKKEVVLGNIYRPPFDNNYEENINLFISELNPVIGQISDNYNRDLLIPGDFYINLLHINYCNKEHFGNFLDLSLGYSLFPKISFPTRLGENSRGK